MQSRRDYTLGEALRTPVFWVMLAMFTATVTGGLMAVAQLSVIAEDLGVRNFQMNFGFFTMAALPFALMMNTMVNGISRPVFGWLSDHIGRERVMFIAFSLEAVGILALGWYGSNPWAFVVLSGIVFFAWGEVYSLFSATAGDTFGTKNIGTIYGLLYCAKGVAALLVPFGNVLMEATGTWTTVLYTMAALDISAALAAILILKPLRRRIVEADARSMPVQSTRQWQCSDAYALIPRAYARDGVSLREWLVSPGKLAPASFKHLGQLARHYLALKQGRVTAAARFPVKVICRPARSTFTPVDTVSRGRAPTRLRPWRSARARVVRRTSAYL